MAKRHKHYSGSKKKGSAGGGSRGKVNHKSKHLRKKQGTPSSAYRGNGSSSWVNSSVPLGDGDLREGPEYGYGDYYNPGRAAISAQNIEDYYFKRGKKTSMKTGGQRLGKRDRSSADLVSENLSFRKRPMVFVKAAKAYDPSHDLLLKLSAKKQDQTVDIASDDEMISDTPLEEKSHEYTVFESSDEDEEIYSSNSPDVIISSGDEDEDDIEDSEVARVSESSLPIEDPVDIPDNDDVETKPDNQLFFVDDIGEEDSSSRPIKVIETNEDIHTRDTDAPNLEFDSSLVIGKVDMKLEQTETGEVVADLSQAPYRNYIKNVFKNINAEVDTSSEGEDADGQFSDDDLYSNQHAGTEARHGFSDNDLEDQISQEIQHLDIDDNEETTQLPVDKAMINNEELDESEKIPEFGFLPEDYVVNTSDVNITNIRLGMNENSYFLQCYALYGDHDSRWINQDILTDYLLEDLGLPEHRLGAYLEFVKNTLIPKEEEPEPTYSDVQFSDSSEENDMLDDDLDGDFTLGDDMTEGLDDLVQYSMKYSKQRNMEYNTKTPVLSGKGKKKKLLIDDSLALDTETIYTLQSKLATRLDNKAYKKKTKEDFISLENSQSSDLFKKYEYGLHIQNIKDEFEEFYSNNRDRLIFPPLDPHGNKTLTKFAKHYNMKTSKAGKGLHTHIMVDKTKKTRRSLPNYGLISQLLKQRPVFMRIDVKRVQEDFVKTERINIRSKGKFHIKEGEIVGENAPEIGNDNIGRRMLEKLGWSQGEGLGAETNKGTSEPVFARVKKGKAGLRLSENKD